MHKIAIVTGNYQGLGKAISEYLPSLGYQEPDLIRSAEYNLCSPDACQRLIKNIIDKYGRLDLLVNNVGNYITGYIDDYSIEAWHEMFNSNLNSAFYMMKFALPYLRQTKGKIINLGYCGLNKLSPPPEIFAYQAAKTALLVTTKAIAKAEAANQVTVNMISPGSLENTIEDSSVLEIIPMKRFAELEEAVRLVEFFVKNDYITGQNLEIAGGRAL